MNLQKSALFFNISLLCTLSAAPLMAQEVAPTPPPADEVIQAEAPTPGVDPGWALYQDAFVSQVRGDSARARAQLEALVARFPQHPAAQSARRVLLAMDESRSPEQIDDTFAQGGKLDTLEQEKPTKLARAELISLQTIHGIVLGAELCALAECGGPRPVAASVLLGGGAALGSSLYLSSFGEGIYPGQALAINSGTAWGAYHALMVIYGVDMRDFNAELATVITGQVAGLGLGALFHHLTRARAGDVSLMNSGGLWATGFFAVGSVAFDYITLDDQIYYPLMLLASDVGIGAAYALGRFEPMTRARTLVIDSGGLLGGLLGFATPFLVNPDQDNERLVALTAMLGAAAGLGASFYLTRNWDRSHQEAKAQPTLGLRAAYENARIGLMPAREGGGLTLETRF